MNQKRLDKAMSAALRRRLKEDPRLNVPAWKRGWYAAGRKINQRSAT